MIPCTEDILKQMYTSQQFNDADETIKPEKITSAEKLRNSKMNNDNSPIVITQQKQPKQAQNDPLRVIPNPIVNESDMKEFESKTVLLDEKRYNASLNMASSIYNHHNQSNNDPNDYERSDSPIICRPPTFEFYENPLRSDQEDEGDCECSCCEDDDDNDDAAK
uniref:Uncharacterized protein n=1 Tax=Trichobilharzia regenti TaxID=157069 RepID=A0AA85K3Q1_TRIRE|nr:unnamed protein product [Trichobilharzia regenti]